MFEIGKKMIYSTSDDEYQLLEDELLGDELVPIRLKDNFRKNWANITDECCARNMVNGNFNNRTNNRLEALNEKIKEAIGTELILMEFGEQFFDFLRIHCMERDNIAARMQLFELTDVPEALRDYYATLTPYAFEFVLRQHKYTKNVKLGETFDGEVYSTISAYGEKFVSMTHCTCTDSRSMMLPCRHIFALRKQKKCQLFEKSLCTQRWTRDYYMLHHRVFKNDSNSLENNSKNASEIVNSEFSVNDSECLNSSEIININDSIKSRTEVVEKPISTKKVTAKGEKKRVPH